MTRKETIEIMRSYKEVLEQRVDNQYNPGLIDVYSIQIEAFEMAIEALQGDMYCPNCGVRLVTEDEYLEPTSTHGRLIDADALSEKLCETTIFIKDGEVFQRMINDAPTVSAEAVPQREQYKKGFEDAKRAFLLEYARESENMRKRNAQLEVMLNAQKAISAEAVQGWSPCSERLPEIDETLRLCDQISEGVLGTDTYGNIRHVYLSDKVRIPQADVLHRRGRDERRHHRMDATTNTIQRK